MDSDFNWSGFDWSYFNSRYLGLPFNGVSYRFPPTIYNSHHLLTCDEIYQSLPRHKAHFLPAEIFSEIFLYMVQADPSAQTKLMLVCWHWHNIMLLTPGIHSQLRISHRTEKKDVERLGKKWLLDVTVDIRDLSSKLGDWRGYQHFNPAEFHVCFVAAAEAGSRWRSLSFLSLPPAEYKDLPVKIGRAHV